jgi:tetratricopeptide (TPR) repeat protein
VPIARLPFLTRLLSIPEIIFYYLKTFFFPLNLAIAQNWTITDISFLHFYLPLLIEVMLFILVFILGFVLYSKNKINYYSYLFFCAWFFLGLGLHIQIFPLDLTVADRWFYLPMVGMLGIIGVLWQSISKERIITQKIITSLFLIAIILFSFRTIVRNMDWQSQIRLLTHDSQVVDSYSIEELLGNAAWDKHELDQAFYHYKKADVLLPNTDYLLSAIGSIYQRKGDLRQARIYHFKAMGGVNAFYSKKHAEFTYVATSMFLYYYDDPLLAKKNIKEGLSDYPNDVNLWIFLAMTEYKMHKQEAALAAIKNAYDLSPSSFVSSIYSQIKNNGIISVPIKEFY